MEGMLKSNTLTLCRTLADLKATSVVGVQMDKICSWTCSLVIATIRSRQHLHSVSSELIRLMRSMGMNVTTDATRTYTSEDKMWNMIDGGGIVLSLMGREARSFYALEDLWYEAEVIYSQDLDGA